MNIIFLDSELELKKGRKKRKNYSDLILDQNYDWREIKGKRRGRPDIAHFCLLLAQDSILNKKGKLRVFIHTRNNEIITVAPETSPPRSLKRFKGIIAKLFREGEIKTKDGKRLFRLEKDKKVEELVKKLGKKVVIMDDEGEEAGNIDFSDKTVIIGGFPCGEYKTKLEGKKIKLADFPLSAWTVTSYVLNH